MDHDDAATLALAFHESAHLVAATFVGLEWDYATILPTNGLAGHVAFRPANLDPATTAFVFWSGAAAESRITGQKLASVLSGFSASADREFFAPYRSPANEAIWNQALDQIWPSIEATAARLILGGTIHPDTPDPLVDPTAVSAFVAGLHPKHPSGRDPRLVSSSRPDGIPLGEPDAA